MKTAVILLVNLALCAATALAQDAVMRNADVVELVKAGFPESTIILKIRSGATAFDTSAADLIKLKKAHVPPKVIEAMLQPRAPQAASQAPSAIATRTPQTPPGGAGLLSLWGTKQTKIDVDRVFLLDGDQRLEMKYSQPTTRRRWVVVMQSFAVLAGASSHLRTTNRSPVFEMILPDNVEVSSIVLLGELASRSNQSREIMISSAYLTSTEGLPPERNKRLIYDKAADQASAPEGYIIYDIRPADPLRPGEYAFIVSKPAAGTFGPMGNANFSYNFYELGVD